MILSEACAFSLREAQLEAVIQGLFRVALEVEILS